jgi:hypothetical protein
MPDNFDQQQPAGAEQHQRTQQQHTAAGRSHGRRRPITPGPPVLACPIIGSVSSHLSALALGGDSRHSSA